MATTRATRCPVANGRISPIDWAIVRLANLLRLPHASCCWCQPCWRFYLTTGECRSCEYAVSNIDSADIPIERV